MAAGTRRIRYNLAAGEVLENLLAGMAIEFPGRASQVEIYGTCEQAANGEVLLDVQFGTDLVAEAMIVPQEINPGEGPRVPDHLMVVDALAPSDRLICRLRNTDAANTSLVEFLIRVQPV